MASWRAIGYNVRRAFNREPLRDEICGAQIDRTQYRRLACQRDRSAHRRPLHGRRHRQDLNHSSKVGLEGSTVTACASCGAPRRPFWPPSATPPAFEKRALVKWLTLSECSACGQLWVGVTYEPYASFIYQVRWDDSAANWSRLAEQSAGRPIVEWAVARIKSTWQQLDLEDQVAVKHHRRRSYGRNPIDL